MIVDLVLAGLLFWETAQGYRRGSVVEVVATVGLVLAVVGAAWLLEWGIEALGPYLSSAGPLLPYLVFLLLFVAGFWGVRRLAWALRSALRATLLGGLDALGGALLGLAKSVVFLSLLLWGAASVGLVLPVHHTEQTIIYPFLVALAPEVVSWVERLFPFLKELIGYVRDAIGQQL